MKETARIDLDSITSSTKWVTFTETPKKKPAFECDNCGFVVSPLIIPCLPKQEYWHKQLPRLLYCRVAAFCTNPDCCAPMGWD